MSMRVKSLLVIVCLLIFFSTKSFAQSAEGHREYLLTEVQDQSPAVAPLPNSMGAVANEIDLLRKSLQTLNSRLREISEKLATADGKPGEGATTQQSRIATNLNLLTLAEERAGVLKKQLFDLVEKETTYRSRLAQLDEDMRPENIERALNGVGTTRTVELRDVRRRVLENERRGVESLLGLTSQSRLRLDEDSRQADSLVSRLRQKVLPLIEREIEKIPN